MLLLLLQVADGKIGSASSASLSNVAKRSGMHGSSNLVKVTASAKVEAHAHTHKMSLTTLIINIVADLCPHGMLPLAYGISQGGPTGLVPALLLLAMFGAMSAFTMTSFAKMASETRSTSIGELWAKLIGPQTKWVADLAVFSLCFGCCIFYSAFAGDIFGALSTALGVRGLLARRSVVLGLVSLLCLLPLCLLEDLSALQFSSLLGVGGIAYTLLFHLLRAVDGSYAPGATMLSDFAPKALPRWPSKARKFRLWSLDSGAFVLVNMLCVAYLAHYNAINYYSELEDASPQRYQRAVYTGFGIAAGVFAGMMCLGYSLFGSATQPLILNNFHKSKDALATGARLATGLAITFAYPLMFNGVKSSMNALLPTKLVAAKAADGKAVLVLSAETKRLRTGAVFAALAAITAVAFQCGEEDVSLVLGIVGSVLGCGVAYVLPGYLGLVRQRVRKLAKLPNSKAEVAINHALVGLGTAFGALGVWMTLQEAAHGGHH